MTSQHKDLTRRHKDLKSPHNHLTSDGRNMKKNQQDAHGPHRSPEKPVQINKHTRMYLNKTILLYNVDLEGENKQLLLDN